MSNRVWFRVSHISFSLLFCSSSLFSSNPEDTVSFENKVKIPMVPFKPADGSPSGSGYTTSVNTDAGTLLNVARVVGEALSGASESKKYKATIKENEARKKRARTQDPDLQLGGNVPAQFFPEEYSPHPNQTLDQMVAGLGATKKPATIDTPPAAGTGVSNVKAGATLVGGMAIVDALQKGSQTTAYKPLTDAQLLAMHQVMKNNAGGNVEQAKQLAAIVTQKPIPNAPNSGNWHQFTNFAGNAWQYTKDFAKDHPYIVIGTGVMVVGGGLYYGGKAVSGYLWPKEWAHFADNEKRTAHIFRDFSGHYAQPTEKAKKAIKDCIKKGKNHGLNERTGNSEFSWINPEDGSQVWAQVRQNGQIVNAGAQTKGKHWVLDEAGRFLEKPEGTKRVWGDGYHWVFAASGLGLLNETKSGLPSLPDAPADYVMPTFRPLPDAPEEITPYEAFSLDMLPTKRRHGL